MNTYEWIWLIKFFFLILKSSLKKKQNKKADKSLYNGIK